MASTVASLRMLRYSGPFVPASHTVQSLLSVCQKTPAEKAPNLTLSAKHGELQDLLSVMYLW